MKLKERTDLKEKAEEEFNTVEQDVKDYFFGSANHTTVGAGIGSSGDVANTTGIDAEFTEADYTDCDYLMSKDITMYWSIVGGMFGLFLLAFVVPYIVCCCNTRWPKCASRWFFYLGLVHWIMGALLSTKLMPTCLLALCGEVFCSAHKYNPGQVWGGVIVGLGFILQCKACSLMRVAKKQQNERNLAVEAEKGALVSTIDTMMDESQRGNGIYKDRPDDNGNDEASSQFPDKLL